MKKFLIYALIFVNLLIAPLFVFSQTDSPVVNSIKADSLGTGKIEVAWSLPTLSLSRITGLYIYRSTRPIVSVEGMEPVAFLQGSAVTYTDTPGSYAEYYYAVVALYTQNATAFVAEDEEELFYDEELDAVPTSKIEGSAYTVILPGVNATVRGVHIAGNTTQVSEISERQRILQEEAGLKTYSADELREQPLPYMDILGDSQVYDLSELKKKSSISSTARKSAQTLLPNADSKKALEEYIFDEDLLRPTIRGDEYTLFEILKNTFIQKEYQKAIQSFTKYLSEPRTESVENRVRFYLGEAYYFTGRLPEALTQFLSVQDTYPSLSHKWILSTLDLYEIPKGYSESSE